MKINQTAFTPNAPNQSSFHAGPSIICATNANINPAFSTEKRIEKSKPVSQRKPEGRGMRVVSIESPKEKKSRNAIAMLGRAMGVSRSRTILSKKIEGLAMFRRKNYSRTRASLSESPPAHTDASRRLGPHSRATACRTEASVSRPILAEAVIV
jgi:hypothetical protein